MDGSKVKYDPDEVEGLTWATDYENYGIGECARMVEDKVYDDQMKI